MNWFVSLSFRAVIGETYGSKHVPWVQEDKRRDEPHDIRRAQRHYDTEELLVGKQVRERETMFLDLLLDRSDGHEHRGERQVDHDSNPEVHHGHVKLVRTARSVTQGQDETSYQSREIEPFEYDTENFTSRTQEFFVTEISRKDMEDQEEVANTEPGKEHSDRLINELNHQHRLPDEAMITPPDLVEVRNGIYSSEETTVQPTTTLHDEFRHTIWHISLTRRRLDVLQQPTAVPLGHNFETQNTVFSQVHICCEDTRIRTVHLFTQEVPFQRTLAVLIVL